MSTLSVLQPRWRPRRSQAFDRPRVLWVVTAVVCVFMFAPIVIVALYSFNSSESLFNLRGFSLRWYQEALSGGDTGWRSNLWVSLKIALVTAVACGVVGTTLAFALRRGRPSIARGSGTMIVLDRKSTRLNSSHIQKSRMPSSA